MLRIRFKALSLLVGAALCTSPALFAQTQVGDGAQANERNTTAVGNASKAQTWGATALGAGAVADGGQALLPDGTMGGCVGATAVGTAAHALGCSTTSIGYDSRAEGVGATSTGVAAKASGSNAAAFGTYAEANALGAFAGGAYSLASGVGSVAVGVNSEGSGDASVAIGTTARATANGSTAVGRAAVSIGNSSLAVGTSANASGDSAAAFGSSSNASGDYSVASGLGSQATAEAATATGPWAKSSAPYSMAIGPSAAAEAEDSVAIGNRAAATARGCVAVGSNSRCNEEATAAFGDRRLTGVSRGIVDTDAANVGQVRSVVQTFGGGADVVNGAYIEPLFEFRGGVSYNNVADAMYYLDGRVANLEQNPATGPGALGPQGPQGPAGQDGKDGVGRGSTVTAGKNVVVTDNDDGTQTVGVSDTINLSDEGAIKVAKATLNGEGLSIQGGASVTSAGVNAGGQRVSGVAAGAIAPGSMDAINGGQMWDYQRQQDDRWNLTDRRFRELDKRVSGVCAMAQANAQMATSTSAIHGENRNRFAVGVGGCNGQGAVSIGYARDVTTPRGSPSAFSVGISRSGRDSAIGAAWAIGW